MLILSIFDYMNKAKTAMEEFLHLQNIEDDMLGHIEKITRAFGVPRVRAVLAKQKVSDAVQIMTGSRNSDRAQRFDEVSKENIARLVDELGRGRSCILLLRKEDGSGVVEMLTGKEYQFAK